MGFAERWMARATLEAPWLQNGRFSSFSGLISVLCEYETWEQETDACSRKMYCLSYTYKIGAFLLIYGGKNRPGKISLRKS